MKRTTKKARPKIALDSGTYSISTGATSAKGLTLESYSEYLKTHSHLFEIRFTFDQIGSTIESAKASYQNWLWLRKQGHDTIPVYHIGTPEEYLQRYLKQTDYIALGAIADLSTSHRLNGLTYIWDKYLRDKAGKPKFKVHGLGLTAVKIMQGYPWHSVDSASAVKLSAYGMVFLPLGLKDDLSVAEPLTLFRASLSDRIGESSQIGRAGSKTNQRYVRFWMAEVRDRYSRYIKSLGFELGSMKDEVPEFGADLARWYQDRREDRELTLVDNPYTRALWNAEMLKLCVHARIYNVIPNTRYFKVLENYPVLVSYARPGPLRDLLEYAFKEELIDANAAQA